MRLTYTLPWPPSANDSHVNRKAKIKSGPKAGKVYMARMISDETRAFRQEVHRIVREGHKAPPRLTERLTLTLLMIAPRIVRTRDVSNTIKQTEDALKLAGVVLDDSQFDQVAVYRGPSRDQGAILVSIEQFNPVVALHTLKLAGLADDKLEENLILDLQP